MGTAERKEREKIERRKNIIDAAEKVFFSKGYDNSSMDDVANEVELSKGTLYLYFNSKEDLYAAIVGRGADVMFSLFSKAVENQPNGLSKVKNIGRAFIQFYNEYPNYHDAMMFDQGKITGLGCECQNEIDALAKKKSSNELLVNSVKEGVEDGSIRSDIDPIKTAMVLWGSSMGVLQLVKNKGVILDKMFGVKADEIVEEFMSNAFRTLSP